MADKENKVTQKPDRVMYLSAPARNGSQFSVSWKNPPGNTESSSSSKAKYVGVVWKITCTPSKYTRTYKWQESASATSSTLDLAAVLTSVGTHFFYPYGNATLLTVSCTVHAWNEIGVATDATTTTTMANPAVPELEAFEYDDESAQISVALNLPDDAPNAPVETIWWKVNVYDTATQKTRSSQGSTTSDTTIGDNSWQGGDASAITDIANIAQLEANINRAVKLNFMAKSRGWRGESSQVSQIVYVSRPKIPTIKKVTIPSSYANDKVIVQFAMNKTTAHPVTGCRLQVYQDTEESPHTKASDFNGTETWEDFELTDDGECSSLAIGVSEVVPAPDRTAWVRVKVWNIDEDRLVSHSAPYRLKKLETESPTAEDDRCFLATLDNSGNDSILLHCYWGTAANPDDSTGTEVTWSDSSNAWDSTVQPSSFETELDHGAASYNDGAGLGRSYQGHIDFYIRDLEPGTKYWVRCRRYREGDRKTVGPWSTKMSAIVGTPPASVDLTAPSQIANGKALPCEFNIEAEDEVVAKTRWSIYLDPKVYHLNGSGTTITGILGKSGTGGSAASVPWSKVQSALKASGHKYVDVIITAGFSGATVASDIIRVYVIDPPKCKVVTHTVTEQPATFDVKFNDKIQNLRCVVTAYGASGFNATNQHDQESGDCVWSDVIEEPDHNANRDSDSATYPLRTTVTMPEGLDFRDGARYKVTVSAETLLGDGDGLRGSNATGSFRVSWEHQATYPGLAKITPQDTTDSSGNRTRKATIVLAKPNYNLLAFFGHSLSDTRYWISASAVSATGTTPSYCWYRIGEAFTSNLKLSVKKSAALVSGTTYVIKPNKKYTLVCQVREAVTMGTVKIKCVGGSASVWTGTVATTITGNGTFRVVATTKSSITSSSITSIGVALDATNGGFRGDLRLSLIEGTYTGGVRTVSTPEGRSTDLYDVYRVTPDGATPVAIGAKLNETITDNYAPYGGGNRAYRIVTRTKDGDLTYRDITYRFAGGDMRIDFDGTYVELPYDVSMSDTFSKDFESRAHFGQRTPSGYWNESVSRTSSLSTRLIKIRNRAIEARVRRLAQYDGPCFLRLPNGCAYEADVQVSGISEDEMGNAGISISLDATEVMPSGTYSVVTEDS